MVFSYYVTKPFYAILWHIIKLFRRYPKHILYCDAAFDATLFQNVAPYLAPVSIVAKNKVIKEQLVKQGYHNVTTLPTFPDTVIMFRNMAWRFPCKEIVKIGFAHGAYSFKRHSKASYYNLFDLFFMTSSHDIERVRRLGVTTDLAVAYPKIDPVFNGTISAEHLGQLSQKLGTCYNKGKKTLLFSATWDGSSMSAIHKWYDKISKLSGKYNLLVTLHSWMSQKYVSAIKASKDVFFIEEDVFYDYIKLADVCISDTSSVIAEFCLLDKPIITFTVPFTSRTLPDVMELIQKVSLQIDSFEEIETAVETLLQNPQEYNEARREVVRIMFDNPDGQAGKRAAEKIIALVPSLRREE